MNEETANLSRFAPGCFITTSARVATWNELRSLDATGFMLERTVCLILHANVFPMRECTGVELLLLPSGSRSCVWVCTRAHNFDDPGADSQC